MLQQWLRAGYLSAFGAAMTFIAQRYEVAQLISRLVITIEHSIRLYVMHRYDVLLSKLSLTSAYLTFISIALKSFPALRIPILTSVLNGTRNALTSTMTLPRAISTAPVRPACKRLFAVFADSSFPTIWIARFTSHVFVFAFNRARFSGMTLLAASKPIPARALHSLITRLKKAFHAAIFFVGMLGVVELFIALRTNARLGASGWDAGSGAMDLIGVFIIEPFAASRAKSFGARVLALNTFAGASDLIVLSSKRLSACRTSLNGGLHSMFTSCCLPDVMSAGSGKNYFSGISLADKTNYTSRMAVAL